MLKKKISGLPPWILSALTVALILWLTLSPEPFGDTKPRLFPGADKVVHAIMFGYLTIMLLLDRQRRDGWRKNSRVQIIISACVSTAFGVAVEFIQRLMAMGRGFEISDMIADAAGACLCACLWDTLQTRWTETN